MNRFTALVRRATIVRLDVALMKLAEPLPAPFVPTPLSDARTIGPGDLFIVAGYGVTVRGMAALAARCVPRGWLRPASPAHYSFVSSIP